jgi:TonB family protein
MKNITFTLVLLLWGGLAAFSQGGSAAHQFFTPDPAPELRYEVHPAYTRPIKQEKLKQAKLLRDVVAGYPENWINSYVSTEVSATCNGQVMKATSLSDVLSPEQKKILGMADLATDVIVEVKYNYKEPLTNAMENRDLYVLMTVVPETNAEYVGGYKQMYDYIKMNGIHKISVSSPKKFQKGKVRFAVSEQGEVMNARITESSGDTKTDKLLLETIQSMPEWKPAENPKGVRVMQEFVFSVGNGGC